MNKRNLLPVLAALLLALTGVACVSLDYDLSSIPMPVSAKPAEPGAGEIEPFTIEATNVLWVHGVFGRSSPDVTALLLQEAQGYDRIAGFRVKQESKFSHWLITHLSLTLIRMRTVVIEGQFIRDKRP